MNIDNATRSALTVDGRTLSYVDFGRPTTAGRATSPTWKPSWATWDWTGRLFSGTRSARSMPTSSPPATPSA
ncbi:hypothetical protein ACWEQ7_25720 [Streptomyces sp. NPDC004069]